MGRHAAASRDRQVSPWTQGQRSRFRSGTTSVRRGFGTARGRSRKLAGFGGYSLPKGTLLPKPVVASSSRRVGVGGRPRRVVASSVSAVASSGRRSASSVVGHRSSRRRVVGCRASVGGSSGRRSSVVARRRVVGSSGHRSSIDGHRGDDCHRNCGVCERRVVLQRSRNDFA